MRTRLCWRCSTQIKNSGGDVNEFVRKVKNKEDGVKLMGFGHRVYRNYDPRAAIVKKTARLDPQASSVRTTNCSRSP